jgi:hypothetical protein
MHDFTDIARGPTAVTALDIGRHWGSDRPDDATNRLEHFLTLQFLSVTAPKLHETPALVVAIATAPANWITRALAASRAFGKTSGRDVCN